MELKDVANQALISLIDNVTQAAAFLKGEVPIAVQELLTYYTALHVAGALLSLAFMVIALLWAKHFLRLHKEARAKEGSKKYGHENYYGGDGYAFVAAAFSAPVGAVAALFFCDQFVAILKITLAPRIWLIEYAAGLVK